MKVLCLIALGLFALSLSLQQAQGANLIVNGDFEDIAAGFVQASSNNDGTGDFATLHTAVGPIMGGSWHQDALPGAVGSALIKGDSFTLPGIQIPPGPSSGQQWLYLTNSGNSGSKVSQNVALGPGSFDLSFALSSWAVPDLGSVQARVLVQITDGANVVLSENFVASPLIWTTYRRTIEIAVPGSYNLSFLVDGDTNFATLDTVQVIPESEIYALMLTGLGLIGYAAGRRKRT